MTGTPLQVLERLCSQVEGALDSPLVKDEGILKQVEYVSQCMANRAGVRLLMACMLAKIDRPQVDPRQPYTEIGGTESFSGRTYDERYITQFVNRNRLPCNSTTAFLTPALRNINRPLTTDVVIVGRPAQMYRDVIEILAAVAKGRETPEDVLGDAIRILCIARDAKTMRMEALLAEIEQSKGGIPLSSESIVILLEQHLACKNASRLPVLIVAAAYSAAETMLGESVKTLLSHNAADEQT